MRYQELDSFIAGVGIPGEHPGLSLTDATGFYLGLKKMAQAGLPAPDQDSQEYAAGVATGTEATPAEASARFVTKQPDISGHLEGEFAVPVEQVTQTMAHLVSHELKMQLAYLFYSQMLRDFSREGMVRTFEEIAKQEVADAAYLLRRIGVLMPGGVPIPVPPSPEPLHDPGQILQKMIAGEQQAIVLLKMLRAQLGENPMKFTVEQMLTEEQEHLDKLWQFMPAGIPEKTASEKVASAIKIARAKVADVPMSGMPLAPEPGAESVEQHVFREQVLARQQAEAEKAFLARRLEETRLVATESQARADSAGAQAQMASQQAQMASQQASTATQEATLQAENAAQQADAKMRLAMRISQIRQQLADIVSADPLMEEGAGFGEQAGPGVPVTSSQQARQAQADMEMQAAQQEADPKAAKEQEQAARAQDEAAQQAAQVEQAKTSSLLFAVKSRRPQ